MAPTGDAHDDWIATNRAHWDERVPVHLASPFYDVDGFLAGRSTLRPFEAEELGDVTGRSLLHLQCHFGMDTLSWARRGAIVTGLDFSEPAIAAARHLAERTGLAAEFVTADVYEAVEALGGRQFDIVCTGFGALVWLPDVERWAGVVAALVRPGGTFYLAEFHPLHEVFADDSLTAIRDYFDETGKEFDEQGSYADPGATFEHTKTRERTHGLGSIVTALARSGLRIELLVERDSIAWQRWPFLERHDDGGYRMPAGMPRLPLSYSLRARKG
jgi:SAM-dependent methyltransferase